MNRRRPPIGFLVHQQLRLLPVALLIWTQFAIADSPLCPPRDKVIWSRNRAHCAVLDAQRRITTVYQVRAGKRGKLWAMSGWHRVAFLANDGQHLVTGYPGMNLLTLRHRKDQIMLRFFRRGELIGYVTLDRLIHNRTALQRTISHYYWGDFKGLDKMGHCVVKTVEKRTLRFDVTTGKLWGQDKLKLSPSTTNAQLANLRKLYLQETQVTDAGLTHLKGLRELDLSDTQITDAGLVYLKKLTNLKELNLQSCEKLTDAGLAHLKGLTKLKTLKLARCDKITDAGLVDLKGLTQLKNLELYGTEITDAGLAHLKRLTKLETLYLMETRITDIGLAHLKALTKLEELNLTDTKITDAGLVHLKGLGNLKELNLMDCKKITDAAVSELQKALPKCEITR